jgi:deoxycytidylate deaminase
MKNISSVIKNNFLILGFTGPLASGCTTAARYFSQGGFHDYKKLPAFKDLNNKISNNYGQEDKRADLKEALRSRELLSTLSSYKMGSYAFYEISISTIILKYVVEFCFKNKQFDYAEHQTVLDIIKTMTIDLKLIEKVDHCINEKEYSSLTPEDCSNYDKYLSNLKQKKEEIRNSVESIEFIRAFQDFGDNIRSSGDPLDASKQKIIVAVTFIASSVNRLIKYMRNRRDGNKTNYFTIDSLRNPYEIEYFRYRYYEFYVFSITAILESRKLRRTYNEDIDIRDSGEDNAIHEIHKQNVSKCVYLSDIQIDNTKQDPDKLEFNYKLIKHFALILSPGCITPSTHEAFMNQAYTLSLKSTCISRQVGAVIEGKKGYVVGAGWNDVGKGQIGCGMRRVEDVKNLPEEMITTNPKKFDDFRVQLKTHANEEIFCFKDVFSTYMLNRKASKSIGKLTGELVEKGINLTTEQLKTIASTQAKHMNIKRLEYCRALHAEENALLQSAKIGGMGVSGGTLYTTSFPCELCAKKIYQSGIDEVVYTEPYPDSISQEVILKDGTRKIKLTPFEGVKSHSFYRLYKSDFDKKELQQLEQLYPAQ